MEHKGQKKERGRGEGWGGEGCITHLSSCYYRWDLITRRERGREGGAGEDAHPRLRVWRQVRSGRPALRHVAPAGPTPFPLRVCGEGGGGYAMDADGLGFPLRVRAGATTRTYSRMLRRGWITPADTTRIGWPGVGGTGLVPRVTVWRRPARRRRGAVGLWKADSKAMLSLSSASLTRNGKGGRSDTAAGRGGFRV